MMGMSNYHNAQELDMFGVPEINVFWSKMWICFTIQTKLWSMAASCGSTLLQEWLVHLL